jgi:hypothetical protein
MTKPQPLPYKKKSEMPTTLPPHTTTRSHDQRITERPLPSSGNPEDLYRAEDVGEGKKYQNQNQPSPVPVPVPSRLIVDNERAKARHPPPITPGSSACTHSSPARELLPSASALAWALFVAISSTPPALGDPSCSRPSKRATLVSREEKPVGAAEPKQRSCCSAASPPLALILRFHLHPSIRIFASWGHRL